MVVRPGCVLKFVCLLLIMCCFFEGISQDCTTTKPVSKPMVSTADNATSARGPYRHRLCVCRKYRCSCCVNFSFIRRWPAIGCLNIQSLPGNLNILLSFSFNRRRLAVFPIAGSRPMPFCKQLGLGAALGCLVIYNVRTNTPHDITVCMYLELRVGQHCVATIHMDCIRKIRRHIQFIPIASHTRKGSVLDVHVLPNDTALTILKQEFHWVRAPDRESDSDSDSDSHSSDFDSADDDDDDDEEGEVDLQLPTRRKRFHWLKRLFWWRHLIS